MSDDNDEQYPQQDSLSKLRGLLGIQKQVERKEAQRKAAESTREYWKKKSNVDEDLEPWEREMKDESLSQSELQNANALKHQEDLEKKAKSYSCYTHALKLYECMSNTECLRNGGKVRKCLKRQDDDIEICRPLEYAYRACRIGNTIDRRTRLRPTEWSEN